MPRYRVTWDGFVSGSWHSIEVRGPYLDEERFWEKAFRDSDPLRKFDFEVEVNEIKNEVKPKEGRRRRPATPKDESR